MVLPGCSQPTHKGRIFGWFDLHFALDIVKGCQYPSNATGTNAADETFDILVVVVVVVVVVIVAVIVELTPSVGAEMRLVDILPDDDTNDAPTTVEAVYSD